ncbi:MAG: DUF1566 domain-containing protein [Pseudomonadota bacterium]
MKRKALSGIIGCFIILMLTAAAWATPVPDTGQTKCYNATVEIPCPSPGQPFYGQDANYTINPMSYTKLDGSGNVLPDSATAWAMVKDIVTGLIWEMKTNMDGNSDYSNPHDADNLYTWYNSNQTTNGGNAGTPGEGTDTEDFINALNSTHFGGYSDWRLPSINELDSIVNCDIPYPGLSINTSYFPNTFAFLYWSSNTSASSTTNAWGVTFNYGHVSNTPKCNNFYVRAVRGEQSQSAYVDNGNGTVTDTSTGLMWELKTYKDGVQNYNDPHDADNTYTWEQALSNCETSTLAGHSDWRMPTKKELRSLLDYSHIISPLFNTTYFPDTASAYWSSTTLLLVSTSSWGVYFDGRLTGWEDGYDDGFSKYLSAYVRAVRGGQSVAPPKQNPPGTPFIIPDGPVSLDKPTVILTHGLSDIDDLPGAPDTLWIGTKEKQAAALIKQETGGAVNIFHYIWEDAFQVPYGEVPKGDTYNKAQTYVYTAGEKLAQILLSPLYLGKRYNGKIHFIGHSLGTIVNAYAARAFLEKATNVKTAQFTALDRPDDVKEKIPGCRAFPGCEGYGEDFFGETFQDIQTKPGRDLTLIIDNYYSLEGAGVGDKTNGLNVYNHRLINPYVIDNVILGNEGIDNNHSGVHQWYRWTMNPNGLYPSVDVCAHQTGELPKLPNGFDISLYPCNNGWMFTIVKDWPISLPPPILSRTENRPLTTDTCKIPINNFKDYGCTTTFTSIGTNVIQCKAQTSSTMQHSPVVNAKANIEGQSSPFGICDVEIPGNANYLSFKYRFINAVGSEYAVIFLDNIPIWNFSGSSYSGEGGEFVDSGLISLGELTGKRSLTVSLYGAAQNNAQFEMQDIKTINTIRYIGSNSIDAIDVVKITDMSGSLPAAGSAVTVKAWDKNGIELPAASYAAPLSIFNHGTTSILGADLEDRFSGGTPAAYAFSVESSKMFITNVNNSFNGYVKVPIIYSNGLSNFVSNSIGTRNTIKVTDMSGTIPASGIAISVAAWDASGSAIPESSSAAPLKLYSHGTTTISGSSLPARFPSGTPLTYEFNIGSPKLVISNVKNSVDGTLNIPTVYTIGVSNFVSNSIGPRNTIHISDFSGTLGTGGAGISVRAWDVTGTEIPEAGSAAPLKLYNYGTTSISGSNLAARFPSGTPIAYEFTVVSSKVVITNVKSSTDGSINIPTVYTSGIANYTTNYVSDLNTIQITDMSGSIATGGASITITARDVDGNTISESGSATALKLYNHGTTIIDGYDLRNRFPGGAPVTYEFSIGSSSAVVTNLTESTDGTINIPTVFTIGPYGGI